MTRDMGRDTGEGGYERRIRLASEVASWGIAIILIASAALPTTDAVSRVGLLFSAALLALFALVWFHALPERVFGRLRFTIGTGLTQIVGAILLVLTGGAGSNYFVFFLFPTLATTFAMRISSTLVVGAIGMVAYITILVTDGLLSKGSNALFELGAVRLSAFVALVAMTSLITRTMQETRAALRQRSIELATQNQELEISRSTALAIARARDLGEIIRAVHESARSALGIERVFFFSGPDAAETGYTIGPDGTIEPFAPDTRMRDSPRQRAMRARKPIVVNDLGRETMVSPRLRNDFHVVAGLFVPLIHRGELIGQIVLSVSTPRE